MWIWKSRWMSGRATDCAVWGGGAGVAAASLLTGLTAGLVTLAAVPGGCCLLARGFASLSLASGTFFSASMTYVVAICRAFESPNFWCWNHFVTMALSGLPSAVVSAAKSDG